MSTERRRAPRTSDVRRVARALQEHGVEYAVIGGIAMALHGFPRATKDIELFLPVAAENNKRLLAALDAAAAKAGKSVAKLLEGGAAV